METTRAVPREAGYPDYEEEPAAQPRRAGIPWAYFGLGVVAGIGMGLAAGTFAGARLRKTDDHSSRIGRIQPTLHFAPEIEIRILNNRQIWSFGRRWLGMRRARKAGRRPGLFRWLLRRNEAPRLPVAPGRRALFGFPQILQRRRAA